MMAFRDLSAGDVEAGGDEVGALQKLISDCSSLDPIRPPNDTRDLHAVGAKERALAA